MKLSAVERRLAGMLFDLILPSGAATRMPLSATQAGVVEFFEDHLDFLPTRTRAGLRAAVGLLGGYARTVGRVHPGGPRAALELLSDSRFYVLRESITLLKSVVCLGYFTHPAVRSQMGLDQ
jgi:hypothetical protein